MRDQPYYPLLPAALLLAVVAAAVLIPGLGGAFIFDDLPTIAHNDAFREGWTGVDAIPRAAYSFYAGHGSRALAMLSFAADYWRAGPDPSAFKATNVAIHAITAVVLVFFLRSLLTAAGWTHAHARNGALAIASLWALHPLQVSTVLYVVQRMQMLGTLFLLLSLSSYLRARECQIEGTESRRHFVVAGLFWVLALASKEDSALLPVYLFVLELTILKFRASTPVASRKLRFAYIAMAALGSLAYLLVVVPHYWHTDAYPGRNFSSAERLLTQPRILLHYITQVVLPLPNRLPFYYDDIVVSRSLLAPNSTLTAIVLLAGLACCAFAMRVRRPLFCFGVLLFLAGHFMTSNVLNLELAFEHRNHFPLIGAAIAIGDLAMAVWHRWRPRREYAAALLIFCIAGIASATTVRAYQWGEPTRFAETSVRLAPYSARAWTDLCTHYFDLNGGKPGSHYIDKAIRTCQTGAARTGSPLLLFDVIVYKTFKGVPTKNDWPPFNRSLRAAPVSAEVEGIYFAILTNIDRGFPMDTDGTLAALKTISERARLPPQRYVSMGVYVFNNSATPEAALPFLEKAVRSARPGSPAIEKMYRDLAAADRADWVAYLKTLPMKDVGKP